MLFSCCLLRREPKSNDKSPNPSLRDKEVQTQALTWEETKDSNQIKSQAQHHQKWIPGILKSPTDRYPTRRHVFTQTPSKQKRRQMDYTTASTGILFECNTRSFSVPKSNYMPKKQRSVESGIELITPIRKVGLEGDYDMEMGTEGTGLQPVCWNAGAQVYIRESREMVEIVERRLRGKHLLAKVVYLDQSDTPGRVVEMYLSRLMSIGYLVEKELADTPAHICRMVRGGGGGDCKTTAQETETPRREVLIPSAPKSALLRNKVAAGDDNYYQHHAYPPSRRIKDMAARLSEKLAQRKGKTFETELAPQYGARFSPGQPPIACDNPDDVEEPALKPPPYRECVEAMSVDEPDRAAVVGVRQVVSNFEAKGFSLSGRSLSVGSSRGFQVPTRPHSAPASHIPVDLPKLDITL